MRWLQCVREKTGNEVISIDGKTLRGSFDMASAKEAIHMVSAWSTKNRVVLGQVKVGSKPNEITAVPRLLELLEISGCIITMDAMGCQREYAAQIIGKGADYVLALKGNQGLSHEEVKTFFEDSLKLRFEDVPHQFCSTTERDHGRIETRRCWLLTELRWFEKAKDWPGLQGVGMIESERRVDGKTTKELRFYCTSLRM